VILVDDLLGMGGSIMAAKLLVEKLGMEVAEAVFIFHVDVSIRFLCSKLTPSSSLPIFRSRKDHTRRILTQNVHVGAYLQ